MHILGGGASERVLEHYGLAQPAIVSWGGSIALPDENTGVGGSGRIRTEMESYSSVPR